MGRGGMDSGHICLAHPSRRSWMGSMGRVGSGIAEVFGIMIGIARKRQQLFTVLIDRAFNAELSYHTSTPSLRLLSIDRWKPVCMVAALRNSNYLQLTKDTIVIRRLWPGGQPTEIDRRGAQIAAPVGRE